MPTTEPLNSALEQQFQAKTEALLRADPQRMACLQAAAELNLPDWALGAGFIRNLIWDHLHHKAVPTPLNDIDLIYLDKTDPQGLAEATHETGWQSGCQVSSGRCAIRPACTRGSW